MGCVCAHECRCPRRPETLHPLELISQAVVSHLMSVLGTQLRSSGRIGHALHHHAFPPVQRTTVKKKKLLGWPFGYLHTNYKLIDTFLPSVTLTSPK